MKCIAAVMTELLQATRQQLPENADQEVSRFKVKN
jgi:hypothetical protein